MSEVQGALLTGALIAGGGVAGYLGGRWLVRHYLEGGDLRTAILGPLGRDDGSAGEPSANSGNERKQLPTAPARCRVGST